MDAEQMTNIGYTCNTCEQKCYGGDELMEGMYGIKWNESV